MNPILERIDKLQNSMREEGLDQQSEELETVKDLTRENEEEKENQRPLYEAHPTGVPGTWSESDGDLIKTSRD